MYRKKTNKKTKLRRSLMKISCENNINLLQCCKKLNTDSYPFAYNFTAFPRYFLEQNLLNC